ncbi:I78 family peptidase inhibitor [Streptomyces sp. NPDC026206]|uniref:I78 family peptidase inhibitor n=1 Tax=Streptomyces sp. NPDC026206 TaxID=3157089 RepID=UPI0033ECFDE7
MAPLPNLPSDPDDDPEAYAGLPAEAAADRARGHGWTDVRALPPGAVITMEYRAGRLNFEVRDGIVERCWKG